MVNVEPTKELQNVLPNCNPLVSRIIYHMYEVVRACRWQALILPLRTLTSYVWQIWQ